MIEEDFKVGDLVMDKDSGIMGIILEVHEEEPTQIPFSTEEQINYSYKVRLFRPTISDATYSAFRLTRMSKIT